MTNIVSYLNDGANWQAQAVLAYLRANSEYALSKAESSEPYKWGINTEIKVGRFENGREQGYVFTVRLYNYRTNNGEQMQRNWAVFEHRNWDGIVVFVSDEWTLNTPGIGEIYGERGKSDYDKSFQYGQILECGKWLVEQIRAFIDENYKEKEVEL
jgi:hypothetical protein